MTTTKTEHPHVVRRSGVLGGQPVIQGSRISVASIARFLNDGVSVEEIAATYSHLSLAAIHDAISYYFDHRDELDDLVARSTPEAMAREGYVIRPDGRVSLPGV